VDFVEQLQVLGKTDAEITAALDAAIKTAKTRSIAGEVRQRIADIAAGRYAAIEMCWALLSGLTKALLPGTVTLLAGSGGATKSFMALQTFADWMLRGLRVAIWELEEDRTFHLTRALSQRSGCAGLTDPDWVKDNTELADEIAGKILVPNLEDLSLPTRDLLNHIRTMVKEKQTFIKMVQMEANNRRRGFS